MVVAGGITYEQDGSVFAFLDESFKPFVSAAAVVVEAGDVHRLDADVTAAFEQMSGWHALRGLRSFEEFRKKGFHATNNPPEVQTAFANYLAEVTTFKSLIVYSDRTVLKDLSDKKRLMVVYDRLVRDLVRAYQRRPKVVLCFESAQELDRYVERVVIRAVDSLGRATPEVDIRFCAKRDPDLLALPDFVLYVFGKFFETADPSTLAVDPAKREARAFRTILGSVSMARSLDDGTVIRRGFS